MSHVPSNPQANLHYVRDMLEQLKVVSGTQGGPLLLYLIDMAKHEAMIEIQRHADRPQARSETRPSE